MMGFTHDWLMTLCDPTDCPQGPSVHGVSRQEHWSGLPCPPPGDLPDPGTEPMALASSVLTGRFFTTNTAWEALTHMGDSYMGGPEGDVEQCPCEKKEEP